MTDHSPSLTVSTGPTSPPKARFHWLDLLRALAVLLVIWAHLVGGYLERSGATWFASTAADRLFLEPFAITQHGGFLGVALFFLVSGYIITHVARRETAWEFSVKRLLRIYPPLIVAVALSIVVTAALQPDDPSLPTVMQVITNITLVNYLIVPQVILVGVAWSLVVEVIFYCLTLATRRMLVSRAISLQPLILLAATGVTIATAGSFGDSWFLFAVSFSYIPILVIGSLFALAGARLIAPIPAAVLAVAAWMTFLLGTERYYPSFVDVSASYPISAAVAIGLFSIGYFLRDRIPRFRPIAAVALTSYSIYLLHGIIGLTAVTLLAPRWGYAPALVLALSLVALASTLSYFLVERPSQRLGTALMRRRRVAAKKRSTDQRDALNEPDLVHAEHHDGDRE